MKRWITKFQRIVGNDFDDLGNKINKFLEENRNLEDFEIVDIQYEKSEKIYKCTDPRAANIIYRYIEYIVTKSIEVRQRIDGEEI